MHELLQVCHGGDAVVVEPQARELAVVGVWGGGKISDFPP